MIDFFEQPEISFRAKYAVEACKLISFDLLRQLAILPRWVFLGSRWAHWTGSEIDGLIIRTGSNEARGLRV